jgi:hypothetical protein
VTDRDWVCFKQREEYPLAVDACGVRRGGEDEGEEDSEFDHRGLTSQNTNIVPTRTIRMISGGA